MKCPQINHINLNDISFIDEVGKVFIFEDRIFRAINSPEDAVFYEKFLGESWIKEIFDVGLVRTWVCQEIRIKGIPLILEHQRIPFETHPVENTDYMHWEMANKTIDLAIALDKHGLALKDAHPWNLMYLRGRPVFVDFTSVRKQAVSVDIWLTEFYTYFAVPIWIASTKWRRFSKEYRREHLSGFGIEFFNTRYLRRVVWGRYFSIAKKKKNFLEILFSIKSWLETHKPSCSHDGQWLDYEQTHGALNPLVPVNEKQRFVQEILSSNRPATVLDCGANKGFYSEMAARLGAKVIAFDCEESSIHACIENATRHSIDITAVQMDFRRPTPAHGFGLLVRSSTERFRSDVVLALGIMHHLCITQRYPIRLFCRTCMLYSKKGVILEYIAPEDEHLRKLKGRVPIDYSLQHAIDIFGENNFRVSDFFVWDKGGLDRRLLYLEKK